MDKEQQQQQQQQFKQEQMQMHQHQQQQQQQHQNPHHHQVHMQPKGRGRPRASFAQTGEFDLGLIREYKSRPALYDRTSKRFKDKLFAAQQWQIISHKLGYDVSLLRDRMLQLRNRYNIEKRRLESLKMENPNAIVDSQWPLYSSLDFLSNHIRTRRSFKSLHKSTEGINEENYEMDDMRSESDSHVKQEMGSDDGDVDQDDDDNDFNEHLPVTTVLNYPQGDTYCNRPYMVQVNGSINGRSSSPVSSKKMMMGGIGNAVIAAPKRKSTPIPDVVKLPKRNTYNSPPIAATTHPSNAFTSFGEFVGISLSSLPTPVAWRLVQKFTNELAQVQPTQQQLQQQQQQSQSQSESEDLDEESTRQVRV